MIRFGPMSIVLLLGAVQGTFVSVGLLRVRTNRRANALLSALILVLTLKLVPYVIGYAGFYDAYPWLDLAPFDLGLGIGPLLFLYIGSLTSGRLPRRWLLHLLPLAVQLAALSAMFAQSLDWKRRFEATAGPAFNDAVNLLEAASLTIYLVLAWAALRRYGIWLRGRPSEPSAHRFGLVRGALLALSITLGTFVLAKLGRVFTGGLSYTQMFPFYLLLTVEVYAFGFLALRFAELALPVPSPSPEPTAAKETNWTEVAAELTVALRASGVWRDPLLSLADAAAALGASEARLSRAVNTGLGITFGEWLNRERIEEVARELLASPRRPVLEIAQACGFNSKASFNRWFRDLKECAPTAYRERARQDPAPAPEPCPGPERCPGPSETP